MSLFRLLFAALTPTLLAISLAIPSAFAKGEIVGIVGDVHSNLGAFATALRQMKEKGVTHIIGMGDFLDGYEYTEDLERALKLITPFSGVPKENIFLIPGDAEFESYNQTRNNLKRWPEKPNETLAKYGHLVVEDHKQVGFVVIGGEKIALSHYPMDGLQIPRELQGRFKYDYPPGAKDLPAPAGLDLMIFGDTHSFGGYVDPHSGTLVINPGTVSTKRVNDPPTYALYYPEDGRVEMKDADNGTVLREIKIATRGPKTETPAWQLANRVGRETGKAEVEETQTAEQERKKPALSREQRADRFEIALREDVPRVAEFRYIREHAGGAKGVYLFGQSADDFARYVARDVQRLQHEAEYQAWRFDFDSTHIYEQGRDLLLVVDGTPEQARDLEHAFTSKYPYLFGDISEAYPTEAGKLKSRLKIATLDEVKGSAGKFGDSEAFLLLEITESNGPIVRDVEDWDMGARRALESIAEGTIEFTGHDFLAVTKTLLRASRQRLAIDANSVAKMKEIAHRFDAKNAPEAMKVMLHEIHEKIMTEAMDIDFTYNRIADKDFRDVFEEIGRTEPYYGSLPPGTPRRTWSWKRPLQGSAIGKGTGPTAAEEKLRRVSHATGFGGFYAFQNINRNPSGVPNLMPASISQTGDHGFFTAIGDEGMNRSGSFTVHLTPLSNARRDDFEHGDYSAKGAVVIQNPQAFRTDQIPIALSPEEYLELVAKGDFAHDRVIPAYEQGLVLEYRRRLLKNSLSFGAAEEASLVALAKKSLDSPAFQKIWFSLPLSGKYPELLEAAAKAAYTVHETLSVLALPHWRGRADFPEIIGKYFHAALEADHRNAKYFLTSPFAHDHPEWIVELAKKPDIVFTVRVVLKDDPYWAKFAEVSDPKASDAILSGIEGKVHCRSLLFKP